MMDGSTEAVSCMVEWRYASMVSLVLFVMTPGVTLKLLLSVVNLSFHLMVSIKLHQPKGLGLY